MCGNVGRMTRALRVVVLATLGAGCMGSRPAPEATPAGAPRRLEDAGSMIEHLPVVIGSIDGKPVTLLLDTGASITCLQRPALERIGRRAVGNSRLGGLGDTTRTIQTFGAATLLLGELAAPVTSLHGCPTLTLLGRSGRSIDGVLGDDVLRALTVVIDYPENTVRILPAGSEVAGDSAIALPVVFVRDLPIIEVEVRSRGRWERVSLLLDTGADASLLLTAEAAAALDLEPEPFQQPIERTGLGGLVTTRSYYVSRARFGTLVVRDLPVEVATTGLTQLQAQGAHGIAGADFLRHFRVALHLGNGRMSLDAPGPDLSLCGSLSGICVAPRATRDGYVVEAVRPRSLAARHSIGRGETITHVGATPTIRMSAAEMRASLRPVNGRISLLLRNAFGRVRRVDMRVSE